MSRKIIFTSNRGLKGLCFAIGIIRLQVNCERVGGF